MEQETFELDSFVFESREIYDFAKKEIEIIREIRGNEGFSKPQNVLKVYNRLVSEKTFSTIIGYSFLLEIRESLIRNGISTAEALKEIPVKSQVGKTADTLPPRATGESRYKLLYEMQKVTNSKYKIALVATVIFLIGVIFITLQSKYSIFTYFTDYETRIENEIIDKYEHWEEELKNREEAIKNP